MTIKNVVLIVALVITGTALVSLVDWEAWDGGFQQIEYCVTFLDENNHPLKGVQLRVFDSQGNTSWGYPVTDFTEDLIPTSNKKGMITFHHVNLSPEFGGKCCHLFFMFPLGKCEAPNYTLHFLLSGQLIASFRYIDLEAPGRTSEWTTLPVVTRKWEQKGSSSPLLPEHLRIENRKMPSQLDFYVINKTINVSHY